MSTKSIEAKETDAVDAGGGRGLSGRLDAFCDTRRLALAAFVIGVIVMIPYKPFSRPEVGDPAIYDYVAQVILRGQLPYRDVVDIKGPGAQYMSAAAIKAGSIVGLRDIFAIRAFHVILVGLFCAAIFLVANIYLQSRVAASIAFLIPLLREPIARSFIAGTQPKLPMIIFGLLTLLMIAKDRPIAAGASSMLSCLCWQPGLLFTGTAVLIFSRYLTSWRDLKALKALAGAGTPLVIVLGYFYARGGLGDLWSWTITYNYSVFGPEAGPSLGAALRHIWVISRGLFEKEILLVFVSVLGLSLFLFERTQERIKGRAALQSPDLFRDAIIFPPLIYCAFMLVNFQGGPDLIPLFPFLGLFAGWCFVRVSRWLGRTAPLRKLSPRMAGEAAGIGVLAVILGVVAVRAATFKMRGLKLQDQDAAMEQLRRQFQPGDKIYVHGAVEILVLLNAPNLNPYIDLDWGKDNYVTSKRGGSFQQLIEEMEAASPKYVAIARLRKVYHRAELEQWLDEHYEPLNLPKFNKLYVRKGS